MKTRDLLLRVALVAMCVILCAFASTAAAAPGEGQVDTSKPLRATAEEAAAVNEANAPRVTTLDNGIKIQRTPFDTTSEYGRVVPSWNNMYMNADNRGCTACHTLEQAQDMIETFHGAIFMGYEAEYTVWTCLGCHGFGQKPFKETMHTVHMTSNTFNAMGGNCFSCHYVQDDGSYTLWDLVKYDVVRGITNLSAEQMDLEIAWNQTEITPIEKMFYKNPKSEPDGWLFYDEQITEDIYKNWTITVDGEVENPFEMTIDEMIEAFGTVTQVMKANCVISGIGAPMIFQSEVTGIPLDKIIEYAAPSDEANLVFPTGDDGYCYQISKDEAIDLHSRLVLEVNGQPLPVGQGFPAAFWADNMSAGNFSKRVNKITIQPGAVSYALYGWVWDSEKDDYFNKPNMGILTAHDAQIFEAGKPIHLEGYADAWDEPITKLEYSFDHGATWIEQPIDEATTQQWVYWTLDLNNDFAPGSYLIKMRATSQRADGTERVMPYTADFMFNVQ